MKNHIAYFFVVPIIGSIIIYLIYFCINNKQKLKATKSGTRLWWIIIVIILSAIFLILSMTFNEFSLDNSIEKVFDYLLILSLILFFVQLIVAIILSLRRNPYFKRLGGVLLSLFAFLFVLLSLIMVYVFIFKTTI